MANTLLKDVGHLTKFDGTNFTRWQQGLLLILEQHELLDIINGKEAKPAEVNIIQQFTIFMFTYYLKPCYEQRLANQCTVTQSLL